MNLFISHRGNINGKLPEENSPELINHVLDLGYYIETDLWYIKNELFLGHDDPQYLINSEFLSKKGIIYHAKNIEALEFSMNKNIHVFWHEDDEYTLTSNGYIWAYPGKPVSNRHKTIIVDNNKPTFKYDCIGICSDYVQLYKTYNI